jgi:hypothetical protein
MNNFLQIRNYLMMKNMLKQHVICKYSEVKTFRIHILFSLIKLQCCGFKEKNKPEKIFNEIDFCNDIDDQTKPLCDEKLKTSLHQNLVGIIIIHGILTGLGAIACIMAIHLTCSTNNAIRHTTFQSRYR